MFRSAKEIAYTGIMVALLIGGQLALSAISGVEIVTAIFAVYCLVFGPIRGAVVATAFSLVRCLVFGFFPQIILLYLIYYNLFALVIGFLGKAIKNKRDIIKLIILTTCAILLTVCFTAIDNAINIYLLKLPKVAIKIYVAQSISVMIGQVICVAITVPLFYYPLSAILLSAKNTLRK